MSPLGQATFNGGARIHSAPPWTSDSVLKGQATLCVLVSSVRFRFVEILLTIASILATVLAAEAAFSLLGLRYVPLRLQGDLPEDVSVFAQSSKFGVIPRDPVLLLGDSYAQGYGDWLLEADPNRNGPFHSAHLIHSLTSRDVVTLGRSGAGSVEGMTAFPATAYGYAKQAWYLRLPLPTVAVVYFYEGNDLNNNLTFLQEQQVEDFDAPDIVDRLDRSIAAYQAVFLPYPDWRRHFPLFGFSNRIARRLYAGLTSLKPMQGSEPANAPRETESDPPNVVEVAGRAIELPANLQSPAMELTRMEAERAVLVYERSLTFLHKLLPGVPILVVYLPSPLSSYRLLGLEVSIQQYIPGRATRYLKERVAEDSNRICLMIRAATTNHGAGFLDLRAAIRASSIHDILHGPRDFKHFNRNGMKALGQAVADRIDQPLTQDSCSQSENSNSSR